MSTDATSQIKELESKIQQLRVSQLSELKEKLQEAILTVATLEAEIAKLTGKPASAGVVIRQTRTRTNPADIRARVLKALAETPTGLSPKEISDSTGINYQTVAMFLKKNLKDFKFTGSLKSKRYFLK